MSKKLIIPILALVALWAVGSKYLPPEPQGASTGQMVSRERYDSLQAAYYRLDNEYYQLQAVNQELKDSLKRQGYVCRAVDLWQRLQVQEAE